MIIETLMKDESKLAFDCAKATLQKGAIERIEIDDIHYKSKEIQNALNAKLIRIIGPIPTLLAEEAKPNEPEQTIEFVNNYRYTLSFDCMKKSVESGKKIKIPLSKIDSNEVQTSIARGWISDIENPLPMPTGSSPVQLEELTAGDLIEPVKEAMKEPAVPPRIAKGRASRSPRSRQRAATTSQIKAKPIGRANDEDDSNDLFKESQLIDLNSPVNDSIQNVPIASKNAVEEKTEEIKDDSFDFMDVFAKSQPKAKK